MSNLVLIGSGGHARACLDAWDPAVALPRGYLAPEPGDVLGLPHLGGDDALPGLVGEGVTHAFVALGAASVRSRLSEWCRDSGLDLVTVVAPSAHVGPTACLGDGSIVMHHAIVGAAVEIGRGVIVNNGATVDHDCVIGDWVHIAPGANLAGTVRVGEGALIGVGACVIPGIAIGAGATVGAGAVVVRDVEPGTTVVSVPARELIR